MQTAKYFLQPLNPDADVIADKEEFLKWLPRTVEVSRPNPYTLILEDQDHHETAILENSKANDQLVFTCDQGSSALIIPLKRFAATSQYSIFSVEMGCFLPRRTYIRDIVSSSYVPLDYQQVLNEKGYTIKFHDHLDDDLYLFYATKKNDEKVYFINPYLLKFLANFTTKNSDTAEFSYPVAPNIDMFVKYIERDLIPYDFYEFYNRSLKILNHSHLDINNPGRKIFIKPFVMSIHDEGLDFFKVQESHGTVIRMDKIRPGENLDQSLKRFLSENDLANDYLRANVINTIEFDRDKNDILTPRLIVKVYIDSDNQTLKPTRTWKSIEN